MRTSNKSKLIQTALFTVLFSLGTFTSYSQETKENKENKETQTLIGNGISLNKIGFMASAGADYTQVSKTDAGLFTIKGGLVLNDALTIGAYYGESIWDIKPEELGPLYGANANMDFKVFGGLLEYTFFSNKLWHLTMPLKIGAIELELDDHYLPGAPFIERENYERYYLSIEPQLHLELNVHKYARVFAGAGYRFSNTELYSQGGYVPAPGNAVSAQIGIKIGMFRLKS